MLYKLRCGASHNANLGRPDMKHTGYDRIVFILPGYPGVIQGVKMGDMLATDLSAFCKHMMDATRSWYADHEADPNVVKNMDTLVRYRPRGEIGNSVVGLPVIA